MIELPTNRSQDEWMVLASKMNENSWDDFTLERKGDLTEWLTIEHPNRYHGVWNGYVKEAKKAVDEWIAENLQSVSDEPALSFIKWDVMNVLMEEHYSDLNKAPLFYTKHVIPKWKEGRIPYGWNGNYPDGELLCT